MIISNPLRDARLAEYLSACAGSDYQEYLGAFTKGFRGVRLKRLCEGQGTLVFADTSGEDIRALAALSPRTWDSDVLGVSVASVSHLYGDRAEPKQDLLCEIIKHAASEGTRVLTARVASHDFTSIHALENVGFRLMDCMLVQVLDTRQGKDADKGQSIENSGWLEIVPQRSLEPSLQREVARLCEHSFHHARVYRDPRFTSQQKSMFYERLAARLQQSEDSIGFAAISGNRVCGFVIGAPDNELGELLEDGLGYLWLVAVADARAREGIGTRLVSRFVNGMAGESTLIEVGTQVTNVAAINLYAKCGFRTVTSLATVHLWLA